MKTFSFFALWLASCVFCMGAGTWNGVAFTAWNGASITSWNGSGIGVGGGGGGGTSYTNTGGSGSRTGIITITTNGLSINGTIANGLDGVTGTNAWFWGGATLDGTQWIKFDFGSGKDVLIDEYRHYNTGNQGGSWKMQGSNDDSSWTDIGTEAAYFGSGTPNTITAMSGNTTEYRYYRLLGMSGSISGAPDAREWEFKISGY